MCRSRDWRAAVLGWCLGGAWLGRWGRGGRWGGGGGRRLGAWLAALGRKHLPERFLPPRPRLFGKQPPPARRIQRRIARSRLGRRVVLAPRGRQRRRIQTQERRQTPAHLQPTQALRSSHVNDPGLFGRSQDQQGPGGGEETGRSPPFILEKLQRLAL